VIRNTCGACGAALLASVLALASAACATAGGGSQLQADLDALQQQVWKLQKDNVALTQQLTQAGAAPAAPDPGTAELRARLDSLAHEIEMMRTRADEADQRVAAMANDLRTLREALESFSRTQTAMTAPPPAGPPSTPAGPGGAAPERPAATAPDTAPGGWGGSDLYRQAYADYARGNADRALQELEDFIRLHPGDDLADDAEFMVGEVYFSQQKYQEAVAAYDRLLKEHAAGDKAASAYLKKGLALLEMNRTADAVIQLQHVVTAFPKSDEARIARERLKALGLRER